MSVSLCGALLEDFKRFFRIFPSLCNWFDRIAPAMLRQASYGTIKIGTYQSLKRLFVERPEGEWGIFCPSGFGSVFFRLFVTLLLLRRALGIRLNELCLKLVSYQPNLGD